MEAFKHKLISLGLFSTVLRNVPLEGNNEIDIPYIPLATSASKDFDGTYKFDKGDMESRKITIDRRKYQSLTYTSEEKARPKTSCSTFCWSLRRKTSETPF